ncbi:hypothetical protein A2U01_0101056, partial [Trifolium medium]|nr:hypothetical protein [Trifolium medium]
MHLKFSLEPETLFVKKDFVENPTFEAFKTEVRKDISAQNAKLEELCAKQEAMGSDLKLILS